MGKENNIVHQYFKKEEKGLKTLLKVNPLTFNGIEITVSAQGNDSRALEFDATVFDALKAAGFEAVNAMEFNLYDAGLL